MSLTALDPTRLPDEIVIDPVDQDGNRRESGVCRDPDCRGAMKATRESVRENEVKRRAYWSHKVKPSLPNHSDSVPAHRDAKTPWHTDWQLTADDPSMREHRVYVSKAVRIADVFTRYGWAIEFQHSNIDGKTIADRERHYEGRVVWVVDMTPDTGIWGSVDFYSNTLRMTTAPPWLSLVRGLIAVDDGTSVHVLSPAAAGNTGMIERCPIERMRSFSRADFIALWVNGTVPPYSQITTMWMLDSAQTAEQLAAKRAKKEQRDRARSANLLSIEGEKCRYEGQSARVLTQLEPQTATKSSRDLGRFRHQPFVMNEMQKAEWLVMRELGGVVIDRIEHEVSA